MGVFTIKSLAVTYFRIDKANTSIGAERFHFRVRKGIGWFLLAMAARQTGYDLTLGPYGPSRRSTIRSRFDAVTFRVTFSPHMISQDHWVLYGQVSRAISIG